MFTSVSIYLIFAGLRMIAPDRVKRFRFGWGRILLGLWMLLGQLAQYLHLNRQGPIPLFEPSNATQAIAMQFTGVVMVLFAVCLIAWGMWTGFSARKPKANTDPTTHGAVVG